MKSKYESHVVPKLTLIEAWARNAVTDEQIAKNLGVAYSTFHTYKGKHPELLEALARGKEIVDVEAENALFRKATGYDAVETNKEYKIVRDEWGNETRELVKEKVTTKHYPGDTTALMFWLANRKPTDWKYRPGEGDATDTNETGVVLLPPIDPDADETAEGGGA